jgi:PAS domain S-box-containing protein
LEQSARVFSNTADGAFAVDRRQRIVMWNRAATTLLGHPPEAVLGRRCFEVLRGRDGGGVHCRRGCELMAAARRLDMPATTEVAVRTAGGKSGGCPSER